MDPENEFASLLEPKLLILFVLLYDTKSVTKAADKLGQSQPNISLWLSRLREQLGDPLFVRAHGGMLPTPRAEMLIDPVRAALHSLRRLSLPAGEFDAGQANRTFRICMADGSHITLLPRLLKELRRQAPMLRLEIFPLDSHTPGTLASGKVDLAIGVTAELDPDLYQQTLFEQDFMCLLARDHPLANGELTLSGYLQASHVGVSSGMSSELLDKTLKAERVKRRVILSLPGFLGLASMVADSDLVATVPRQIGEVLARNAGLCVKPCPVKVPPFSAKQIWHMRMHHDPANRWLRKLCASTLMA